MYNTRDFSKTVDDLDRLLELLDEVAKDNDAAEDYCSSVRGQALDMKAWIEKNQHATDKQQKAVDNWFKGAHRWLASENFKD